MLCCMDYQRDSYHFHTWHVVELMKTIPPDHIIHAEPEHDPRVQKKINSQTLRLHLTCRPNTLLGVHTLAIDTATCTCLSH
jgi:hypothetical protein